MTFRLLRRRLWDVQHFQGEKKEREKYQRVKCAHRISKRSAAPRRAPPLTVIVDRLLSCDVVRGDLMNLELAMCRRVKRRRWVGRASSSSSPPPPLQHKKKRVNADELRVEKTR